MLIQETCTHEWISSDDFAERFCAEIQMCRRIAAGGDLAESVCLIAMYRRWFRAELAATGHRLH